MRDGPSKLHAFSETGGGAYVVGSASGHLDVAGGVLRAAVDLVLATNCVRHRAASVASLLEGATRLTITTPRFKIKGDDSFAPLFLGTQTVLSISRKNRILLFNSK